MEARCLVERPADVAEFLATGAGRSFATSFAFERALDLEGRAGDRRCFVVRSASGALVAALPGRIERRFGGAWLRAQPHGAPAGPVFAAGCDTAAAGFALWDCVARTARAEGWLGGDVTLTSSVALPPSGLGSLRQENAHVIPLDRGVTAWHDSLDKRARQMIRRARERGVVAGVSDSSADLEAVYAQFVAQAQAWGIRRVRPLAFYRALVEPGSVAKLWVGRFEGAVVCGALGFVLPEETYVWWSGAAPAARPVNAFAATLATLIEECGSARVSLGFSGGRMNLTAFKRQLGGEARPVPILELAPRPRTPWHALLAAGRRAVRAHLRPRVAPAAAEAQ